MANLLDRRASYILLLTAVVFPAPICAQAAAPPREPQQQGRPTVATSLIDAEPKICVRYEYDANGNRVARTTQAVVTSGATWGTALLGCFLWSS